MGLFWTEKLQGIQHSDPQAQSFGWHWSKPPFVARTHYQLAITCSFCWKDVWNPHFSWCHGTARWIVAQSCCCCVSEAAAAMLRGAQQVYVTRNAHFTTCWRCRWTPDQWPPSSGSTKIEVLQYNWAAPVVPTREQHRKVLYRPAGLALPQQLIGSCCRSYACNSTALHFKCTQDSPSLYSFSGSSHE